MSGKARGTPSVPINGLTPVQASYWRVTGHTDVMPAQQGVPFERGGKRSLSEDKGQDFFLLIDLNG